VFLLQNAFAQAILDIDSVGHNEKRHSSKESLLRPVQFVQNDEGSKPLKRDYSDYDEAEPVDLSADNLIHDEATQTLTAKGNVELKQAGRTITADEISYNLETDTVIASGNIVIHEINGDVYYADKVELTNKMRDGYVESLRSYLADGGVFTADSGIRENESVITMNNASYSACDCDTDKDGDPAWALKAETITYNEEEHDISYKNAWFEIFGVPVAFTPYFIHSDGQVKRKSGFLAPQLGYDSQLGFVVTPRYYLQDIIGI
jgi:LPS-assembly protein